MELPANVIFPYSVLICAKSRLRGFRSTEIHAARAVSAIRAVQASVRGRHSQSKQRNPRGKRSQRNKRAPSGSAQ